MPIITYQDKQYESKQSESILDCLTRHGVSYPSSCENGICQTCLMQAVEGKPPPKAQEGLKETLKVQNYFLACICQPQESMVVSEPGEGINQKIVAEVVHKEQLNNDIVRFRFTSNTPFDFRAGQFVNLKRDDGLMRSYSIASSPEIDDQIELHIRKLDQGQMTNWLHDSVEVGHNVELSGPVGDCFYIPGKLQQNIILLGTGSGLAPLWGIIQNALEQKHSGIIHLFHGSRQSDGLYLIDELKALADKHPNFKYTPCLTQCSPEDLTAGFTEGRINNVALQTYSDLKDWRAFLCGHPDMVMTMKKKIYLAGASLKDIYADSFVVNKPKNQQS